LIEFESSELFLISVDELQNIEFDTTTSLLANRAFKHRLIFKNCIIIIALWCSATTKAWIFQMMMSSWLLFYQDAIFNIHSTLFCLIETDALLRELLRMSMTSCVMFLRSRMLFVSKSS
jgi:hypothetical protein